MTEHDWKLRAACRGMDPEDFYPTDRSAVPRAIATTCAGCPVRRECLAWALQYEEHGVWAGTTPADRRRLRRDREQRLLNPRRRTA